MKNQPKPLQWGIIGLGKIAHSFCKDLQLVRNTSIAAVASRSTSKAEKFAATYKAAKSYGSYYELFEDELKYENATANISCGFDSQSDMQAKIYGTKGQIFIEPRWHEAEKYTIVNLQKGESYEVSFPKKGRGYTYEIEECQRCIATGKLQSEHWSHQNSLDLMQILDEIRSQIGLKYPFEV